MKGMFFSERRMDERLSVESLVTISDGQRFYVESLTDISMGGVGVETLQEFLSGSRVTMFFLSNSRVKIGGMVRWIHKKGHMHRMGLQFTDMTPKQKNSIHKLIH